MQRPLKLKRLATLALVPAALGLATASTASAATATIGPSTPENITATATAGARLTIGGTMPVSCTTADATADLGSASSALPVTISTNFLPRFPAPSGALCTLPGGVRTTVACVIGSLSATATTVSGRTPIVLSVACLVSVNASSPQCEVLISGLVKGNYVNSSGVITITRFTGDQTLNTNNSSSCTATFRNNTSVVLSNNAVSVGDLTYNTVVTGGSTIPTITVV